MEETLAYYGGAVKALGGGKIAGYGVLFTDEPDLQGERFTKETNLGMRVGDFRDIYYRHGIHPIIQDRELGVATLKEIDDAGAFFQGELNLRDNYEKYIYELAKLGKLGWSTGAVSHLVKKEKKDIGTDLKKWIIGEISLTPNPVEARTSAFPVKSLEDGQIDELDTFIKSLEEPKVPFSTAGLPALDQFCKDVSPNSGVTGEVRSKSAVDAVKEFITVGGVLGEAFGVYASRLLRRTENRALKHADPVHPDTAVQVEGLLVEMDRAATALGSVKEALADLKQLSDLSKAEQKAMMIKARHSLLNYYRISGYKPEELSDGTSTG
jgi:hypothetical protein